jgi:hypothetical protein
VLKIASGDMVPTRIKDQAEGVFAHGATSNVIFDLIIISVVAEVRAFNRRQMLDLRTGLQVQDVHADHKLTVMRIVRSHA